MFQPAQKCKEYFLGHMEETYSLSCSRRIIGAPPTKTGDKVSGPFRLKRQSED